jgi:hypothetical protein
VPSLTLLQRDGKPKAYRWHVLPRNKYFNIYLHKFVGDDDDPGLHDHEYDNCSLVLSPVGYIEQIPGSNDRPPVFFVNVHRRAFRPVFRRAEDPHRVLVCRDNNADPRPCWSLFITLSRRRQWGFWLSDGWKHHRDVIGNYTGYGETKQLEKGR